MSLFAEQADDRAERIAIRISEAIASLNMLKTKSERNPDWPQIDPSDLLLPSSVIHAVAWAPADSGSKTGNNLAARTGQTTLSLRYLTPGPAVRADSPFALELGPEHSGSLKHAVDHNIPAITGSPTGVMIFLPVFTAESAENSVIPQPGKLRGYLIADIKPDALFLNSVPAEQARSKPQNIDVVVRDVSIPSKPTLIYGSAANGHAASPLASIRELDAAGRTWRVVFHAGKASSHLAAWNQRPWPIFILGCALSLVLAAMTWFFFQRGVFASSEMLAAGREETDKEALLRVVAENATECILHLDRTGSILSSNNACQTMFGYSKDEISRLNVRNLLPQAYNRTHNSPVSSEDVETIVQKGGVAEGRHRDGTTFPAELSIAAIGEKDVQTFSGTIRDISEQIKNENRVQLLKEIAIAANESTSEEEMIEKALSLISTMLGWPLAHAYRFDNKIQRFVSTGIWYRRTNDDTRFSEVIKLSETLCFGPGEGMPGMVYASGQPVWVDKGDPANAKLPRANSSAMAGLKSALAFPVKAGGDISLILEFFSFSRVPRDTGFLKLVDAISGQISRLLERLDASRQIEAANNQLSLILETAGEGIYGLDREGKTTFVNKAAEQILGFKADELIGAFQHTTIHHHHADGSPYPVSDCPIAQTLLSGCAHTEDTQVFWRKDGTPIPVEYTATPIRDFDKTVSGAVVVFRDISERKESERRLNQTLEELQYSNSELEKFAYIASHDLKAPLRAISHITDWISDDIAQSCDPKTLDYLSKLRVRIQRMEQLLDDLLEYSRAGRNFDDNMKVRLTDLIDETLDLVNIPENFSVRKIGNLDRFNVERMPLRHILHNLIVNAVKHHRKTTGTIDISAVEGRESIHITVSDDGPGIAPEHHDRIFDMFTTLRPRDEVEGSGMGLALVKKMVYQEGGDIEIRSDVGEGTAFTINWPKSTKSSRLELGRQKNNKRSMRG